MRIWPFLCLSPTRAVSGIARLSLILSLSAALMDGAHGQDPFYPSPPNLDTSRLLMPADLDYQGAFRLSTEKAGSQYGLIYLTGAMSHHPGGDAGGPPDGYPGSIFITGQSSERLTTEIDIPAPAESRTYNALPVARILRPFQRLATVQNASGITVMDVLWMEKQGAQAADKIHVTLGDGYLPPEGLRTYSTTETDFSGATAQRAFMPDRVHCYSDYLMKVPVSWSSRWAPGLTLAGGRHREGDLCGEGPALFLMAPWADASTTEVRTWPVLRYLQSGGSLNSYSKGGDLYFAGDWLEAGAKSAVIFSGRKGLGQPAYGTYCGVQGFHDLAGYKPYLIFFDPEVLGKAYAGLIPAHQPQPYAAIDLSDLLLFPNTTSCQRHHLDDFAFDPANRILYATERSKGDFPVVHVWKVGAATGQPPTPPPPPPPPPDTTTPPDTTAPPATTAPPDTTSPKTGNGPMKPILPIPVPL